MQNASRQDDMNFSERLTRVCPVCGSSSENARRFLEERIDPAKLNEFSFASRKEPEFLNYGMVQCELCDVVYVNRPPSQQDLARAYHSADYDSTEEAVDAAKAYLRQLEPLLETLNKTAALEIGTGTGAFLEELRAKGFDQVVGVEPSAAAIAAAPEYRRAWIKEGIFSGNDYAPESFDFVCCFMTLEHVREPKEIAESVHHLLKPGGVFAAVTHDYRSAVNRALGRLSPIIDVEHMQLFSPQSVTMLFRNAGYSDIKVKPFANRYAMSYWMRLMPISSGIKRQLLRVLRVMHLGDMKMSLNVGNMIIIGVKPKGSADRFTL
jgi:SAM-dependent methyltransferase